MVRNEAEIFSVYLIGETPSAQLVERYEHASSAIGAINERDKKIYEISVKHPSLIPFTDAALAIGDRNALLRKKLLVMLAILETTPEHYEKFRSRNESKLKWISLFFRGGFAVFKMIVGKIILVFV